ncbi:hypothetical protein L7F22_063046 [Adiantum nelumboides]|nr:hypothetical protein [Adiantum nelumboides]
MAEEEQQLKKAAALAYDYDSDPRWAEYMSNVLVPDNRPKSEVERYLKFKFYQRNIDPDLKVERLPSKSSTAFTSTSSSTSQRSNATEARSTPAQGSSHFTRHGSGGISSVRMDQHSIGFLSNSLVIIMGTIATLPFLPLAVSVKSYRFTFLGALIACGHSIYAQYGRPRALTLQAVKAWLQSAIAGKDFLYFLYSIVFITTPFPIKFAMIPVICQSLLNVAQFLKRNFGNASIYRIEETKAIWQEHWDWFHRSLHAVAHVLYSLCRSKDQLECEELEEGFQTYVERWCGGDVEMLRRIEDDLLAFRNTWHFARATAKLQETQLQLVSWWEKYGNGVLTLKVRDIPTIPQEERDLYTLLYEETSTPAHDTRGTRRGRGRPAAASTSAVVGDVSSSCSEEDDESHEDSAEGSDSSDASDQRG